MGHIYKPTLTPTERIDIVLALRSHIAQATRLARGSSIADYWREEIERYSLLLTMFEEMDNDWE